MTLAIAGRQTMKNGSMPNLHEEEDEVGGGLGELHIRQRMNIAKQRMKSGRGKTEQSLKDKRMQLVLSKSTSDLGLLQSAAASNWLDDTSRSTRRMSFQGPPKYVGSGANELSKWINADNIARYHEELNREHPTLRQVLKVDDKIDMKQMTKSQLAALPGDPTSGEKILRRDPTAVQRHVKTYRAAQLAHS
mmetsp:Transcript_151094/g.266714  ORF Transcript_151094/g.266714 Transcript_151094/m.266714 type:complete len:191 (+) Transcript_151094:89-661(+)